MKFNYVILAIIGYSICKLGIDISDIFTVDDYKCLINSTHGDFLMVRGYRSYGAPDPNVMDNLGNAWAAGFDYVDVYMFPCFKCGNPEAQVSQLISAIHDSRYNFVWLDVEIYQWSSDINQNREFIKGLINEMKLCKHTVGIYTDITSWNTIVGIWTEASDLMLWYAHWNGVTSFSDFVPFGGWTKPSMKQYRGDQILCGKDVDFDFY